MEWQAYFEWEQNEHSKQDYYLAQIAAEVRRTMVKKPSQVKVADSLLKFKTTKEVHATNLSASKAFWFAGVGFKRSK